MIEELQTELETVLKAKFKIVPRSTGQGRTASQQTNRVQVLWSGTDLQGRVSFFVTVVVAKRHQMGDMFLEAWNLVRASERFTPNEPVDVGYNSPLLTGGPDVDFVTFTAASDEVLDVVQDAS